MIESNGKIIIVTTKKVIISFLYPRQYVKAKHTIVTSHILIALSNVSPPHKISYHTGGNMPDGSIQVILNELNHIKDALKEVKEDVKDKCSTCTNAALANDKISNQWYHIGALWAAIVLIGGALWTHVTK